jgi:hypothetical protein
MGIISNKFEKFESLSLLSAHHLRKLDAAVAQMKAATTHSGIVHLVAQDTPLAMQAAQSIAQSMDRPLVHVDLSQVSSKWNSETEAELSRVFESAGASGSILFFDEADSLFGKRSEVKDAHDRYANVETSYLLQQLEKFSGVAIMATKGVGLTLPDNCLHQTVNLSELPPE